MGGKIEIRGKNGHIILSSGAYAAREIEIEADSKLSPGAAYNAYSDALHARRFGETYEKDYTQALGTLKGNGAASIFKFIEISDRDGFVVAAVANEDGTLSILDHNYITTLYEKDTYWEEKMSSDGMSIGGIFVQHVPIFGPVDIQLESSRRNTLHLQGAQGKIVFSDQAGTPVSNRKIYLTDSNMEEIAVGESGYIETEYSNVEKIRAGKNSTINVGYGSVATIDASEDNVSIEMDGRGSFLKVESFDHNLITRNNDTLIIRHLGETPEKMFYFEHEKNIYLFAAETGQPEDLRNIKSAAILVGAAGWIPVTAKIEGSLTKLTDENGKEPQESYKKTLAEAIEDRFELEKAMIAMQLTSITIDTQNSDLKTNHVPNLITPPNRGGSQRPR